jgi:deoxyribonuclease V
VGEGGVRPFRDHVGDLVWQVPPGKVTTFGDIARALGDVVAARAVAAVVAEELDPEDFPTHRIVRKDGTLGTHPLGGAEKARRLLAEGVDVADERIEGLGAIRLERFESEAPLKEMRRIQEALGDRLNLGPLGTRPRLLLGVDVAYSRDGDAFAAAVGVDSMSGSITVTRFARLRVDFPYIPTFLAFREMPALEAVLEDVDISDALLLVDGQGTLHPRGFGIACHVGVSLGIPTVGVAKRLLVGTYDRACLKTRGHSAVLIEGEQRGWAITRDAKVKRAVFASPGHRVSVDDALKLVLGSLGRRQPRPLELAHAAATAARREAEEAHSTTSS